MVFFEAVHRIPQMLQHIAEIFGSDRPAAVARELTKLHESIYTGTLGDLAARFGKDIPLKGEFVLVVAGCPDELPVSATEAKRIYTILSTEVAPNVAVALTTEITGMSRNEVYRLTRLND